MPLVDLFHGSCSRNHGAAVPNACMTSGIGSKAGCEDVEVVPLTTGAALAVFSMAMKRERASGYCPQEVFNAVVVFGRVRSQLWFGIAEGPTLSICL